MRCESGNGPIRRSRSSRITGNPDPPLEMAPLITLRHQRSIPFNPLHSSSRTIINHRVQFGGVDDRASGKPECPISNNQQQVYIAIEQPRIRPVARPLMRFISQLFMHVLLHNHNNIVQHKLLKLTKSPEDHLLFRSRTSFPPQP